MENILVKLKAMLNSLPNKELEQMDFIGQTIVKNVEVIALDDNSISLITDKEKLEINGFSW